MTRFEVIGTVRCAYICMCMCAHMSMYVWYTDAGERVQYIHT